MQFKKVLMAGLVFLYIVIAVMFAFSLDTFEGMAGATGNFISEIPYAPDMTPNTTMLIFPGLLLVLSIIVVMVYLRSD